MLLARLRETYLTIPVKLDSELLELKAGESDPQAIRGWQLHRCRKSRPSRGHTVCQRPLEPTRTCTSS